MNATKTPWTAKQDPAGGWYIETPEGTLCNIGPFDEDRLTEEARDPLFTPRGADEANARLIVRAVNGLQTLRARMEKSQEIIHHMKIKYSVQNLKSEVVLITLLKDSEYVTGKGSNPYRETLAIGYAIDTDSFVPIIRCKGNGTADDRVLCERDSTPDETYPPMAMRAAADNVREIIADEDNPWDIDALGELADWLEATAADYAATAGEPV